MQCSHMALAPRSHNVGAGQWKCVQDVCCKYKILRRWDEKYWLSKRGLVSPSPTFGTSNFLYCINISTISCIFGGIILSFWRTVASMSFIINF